MPPMHDDDLSADPIIPQNRGARRCQNRMRLPKPYRIGCGAVARLTRTGQAGPWPIRPWHRWPRPDRASGAILEAAGVAASGTQATAVTKFGNFPNLGSESLCVDRI